MGMVEKSIWGFVFGVSGRAGRQSLSKGSELLGGNETAGKRFPFLRPRRVMIR
jgi:hypothetical protein